MYLMDIKSVLLSKTFGSVDVFILFHKNSIIPSHIYVSVIINKLITTSNIILR